MMETKPKHALFRRVAALGVVGGHLTPEALRTITDADGSLLVRVVDGILVDRFQAHPAEIDAILSETK